ncbi:MAG: hypothetical protein J5859_02325, partial [Clostridia bacterium]|nr:hypothetical protein [Clostridia bacterium]
MSKARSEARALKYLFPLLLLLVICSIPAHASAEENLLADPDIEGLVSGIDFWETDAWDESRTYFGTDTREDGGSCLYIF